MMHRDAQRYKREENEARVTGGIRGVIEAGMTRERKAVILGMCSFQHKWASERQLYLFVLLHHVIMK